jgi:RNA recognition motif. (a.k.a. RRM, RBD, or RNP domain)
MYPVVCSACKQIHAQQQRTWSGFFFFFLETNSLVLSNLQNYTYGSSYGSQFPPSQAQANAQTPTRSLWIGNIDSSISEDDLQQLFSPFGPIESLRLLVDKECAFINFSNVEDAVHAKDEVLGRLNGRVGQCVVRVGFGKIEAGVADPSVLQPTRALCKWHPPPHRFP